MTPGTTPTVGLIANQPQFVYLIERYGERSGCRIMSVDTVDKAMKLMQQDCLAMVLLHISGWPHEGWPILQALKQCSKTHSVPITIISAVADEARARAEGAMYWLWQPVMYDDFEAALVATGVLPASKDRQVVA